MTKQIKQIRIKITKAFFDNNKILYQKHYSKKYILPVRWLLFLGIDLLKFLKVAKIKLSSHS